MKDVPGQAKELTKLKTSDLAVQLAQEMWTGHSTTWLDPKSQFKM